MSFLTQPREVKETKWPASSCSQPAPAYLIDHTCDGCPSFPGRGKLVPFLCKIGFQDGISSAVIEREGVCLIIFILYLGGRWYSWGLYCSTGKEMKKCKWRCAAWGSSGLEQEIDSINLQEFLLLRRGSYNEFSFWELSEKGDFQSQLPEILSVWSWFLLLKVQVHSFLCKIIWKGTWDSHVCFNLFICIVNLWK